jgi:hypothetical protein
MREFLIDENKLDEWVRGNAQTAQGVIVELIWHLLAGSCPSPRELRIPLGDSIGQHGLDAVLGTSIGFEPFVPEGESYWEIGTSLRAARKATSDYNDLIKAVPENIRHQATFIFVTPLSGRRDWEFTWKEDGQASWIEEHRNRKEWKDVRIIDGTKLIQWIHLFPPVELWLAKIISRLPIQQLETLEQHWDILRSYGEPQIPSLIPDVFLVNRNEASAKLKEIFEYKIVQLKLTTHYPEQVADFVSAYQASLDKMSRIDVSSRTLIVKEVEAWNTLCIHYRRLILIAGPGLDLDVELIQKAFKASHAVIFGSLPGGIPESANVPLPMPRIHQLQEALEKSGYSNELARSLSQTSNGNLSSLLRLLKRLPLQPEWAQGAEASELAIAVILGSWSENYEADRIIVENLCGRSYDEFIRKIREISCQPGTPLSFRDGNWKFAVRYEGWYALGSQLFDEHLDRLLESAVRVLSERDPQFDLPAEKRIAARMCGKVLRNSNLLRTGLAESLALIGSHPRSLTNFTSAKAELVAALAVQRILEGAEWIKWASLNSLLPLLAEASPGEFLNAIERTLQIEPCPFDIIFMQESGGIFGRNYISGLLWALESLAWDSEYLTRALICLGELDSRDPGGQWSNRPINSMVNILLPWHPQTCAPVTRRIGAATALITELPDVGWKLLLGLLPQSRSVSVGTRRPTWRGTIPDDWTNNVSPEEYCEQVYSYAELAFREAKKELSKLVELIGHLASLPQPILEQFLEYLASENIQTMPENDRMVLWTKLIDLITEHKNFAGAQWALPSEQVDKIAMIADQLAPNAPFYRHQRFFIGRISDLFEGKGDYREQIKKIETYRKQAIREVAESGGLDSVLDFAKAVESPRNVGISFGAVASRETDCVILPSLLNSEFNSLAEFAGGFVLARFQNLGRQWIESIDTTQWTTADIGQFLSLLPFTQDTWEFSRQLLGEDESEYWCRTVVNPYLAAGTLDYAIDKLICYGRPYAAIDCLNGVLHNTQHVDKGQAIRALLEALESSESPSSIDDYAVVEIIEALQIDESINPYDLFQIEWAYLQLLERHSKASAKFLEWRLAKEPKFFCEIIRLAFPSKNEDLPNEESGENAYYLLSKWHIPPGLCEDGSYDGDFLNSWLEVVKTECTQTGHLEMAMTMVGHVLIHVPPDLDGMWIHRSAAAALNALDADDMRNGFWTELYASRGVHPIDPTGESERALAAKYRMLAEATEGANYFRLAASLRQLCERYKDEAERIASEGAF